MNKLLEFLDDNKIKSIAIFSHIRADGDTLGAQIALFQVLTEIGYEVRLYNQYKEISRNFSYLKHYDKICFFDDSSYLPDACIAVDCATKERIGSLPEKLHHLHWINIDHHISNLEYGDFNIVKPNASSTCEVLAELFSTTDIAINADTATALYTGLSTDTGSFLYQNVSEKTLSLASWLLKLGADKEIIRTRIYENMSHTQLEIYKYLYSNIKFHFDNKIAYCVFSLATLNKLHAKSSDLEGIVSQIKNIQDVEVAIVFTENEENNIKISMRSKEYYDVNAICTLFGGGGHIRASGATYNGILKECVDKVLSSLVKNWVE